MELPIGPTGVDTSTAGVPVIYGQGGLTTGRITAIAADPTNPKTSSTSASPGRRSVWKTTDGGTDVVDHHRQSQANARDRLDRRLQALNNRPRRSTRAPATRTTGSRFDSSDAGAGNCIKSTDGGTTWTLLGQTPPSRVRRSARSSLILDGNANNVYRRGQQQRRRVRCPAYNSQHRRLRHLPFDRRRHHLDGPHGFSSPSF